MFKLLALNNKVLLLIIAAINLISCNQDILNSPYPELNSADNILYSPFSSRPKHLDPARSYSSDESRIIGQIYEPILQYNYLKRPYQLEPLTATKMPSIHYLDAQDQIVSADDPSMVTSVYTIDIKPNIYYQPHPAWLNIDLKNLNRQQLIDLFVNTPNTNKRELTAADYVYQIKRLAVPSLHSPIYGFLAKYIQGLTELRQKLQLIAKDSSDESWLDIRNIEFAGAKVLSKYQYQIRINGQYTQFKYWLAMNFFAPIPWEADKFYQQKILRDHNINLDWYPVGTGAYLLSVNNPNLKMILDKNPNFHDDFYPNTGEPNDQVNGMLADAGKKLPFINQIIYSLEKESTPLWNKFLQGFYDSSAISSSSFDQAINMQNGSPELSENMMNRQIQLKTLVDTSIYYMGFNMTDSVVGGLSSSAKKLRQAISIAINYEEYISIFLNGRAIAAQNPIPPGIFGFNNPKDNLNHKVYDWINGKAKRKSIEYAKQLLAEAGYPNGIDPKTNKPLILHLDGTESSDNSVHKWYIQQFKKLNINLVLRLTDYNRFQDKINQSKAQIFSFGWRADYPDPENFLFLLYGENAKIKSGGSNAANYINPKFDELFEKMQNMPNNLARLDVIKQINVILQEDSPWVWGIHPKTFGLYHSWVKNKKPNAMVSNGVKYIRLNPEIRAQKIKKWNQPNFLPMLIILLLVAIFIGITALSYRRKLHTSIKQKIAQQNKAKL